VGQSAEVEAQETMTRAGMADLGVWKGHTLVRKDILAVALPVGLSAMISSNRLGPIEPAEVWNKATTSQSGCRERRFTGGMYHGPRMRPALEAGSSLYEWRVLRPDRQSTEPGRG
jgi:hypothetical protein